MENSLYSQVVMILRRESDDKKEIEKTNKYNYQGKSSWSRRWLDLDHEGSKENFMTREPDFYERLYQTKFRDGDKKYFRYFEYQYVMRT